MRRLRISDLSWISEVVRRSGALRLLDVLRRNKLFAVLLLLGAALRLIATLAYYPALLYIDSFDYVSRAYSFDPTGRDPLGYSWFLRGVLTVGNLSVVAVVQHLLGLGMAVALYAVMRRRGVRTWLAALGTAPVLLDAYQVQIEQNVLSDTMFEAMAIAVLVLLAWRPRPTPWLCIAAGVIAGASVTVRSVGEVLVVLTAGYILFAVRGWRRRAATVAVALLGVSLPLAAYASFYDYRTGRLGLSGQADNGLYGRAATVADCSRLPLDAAERQLCPVEPLGHRYGADYYLNSPSSPLGSANARAAVGRSDIDTPVAAAGFARIVLLHEPLPFAHAVFADFLHGFSPDSHVAPSDTPSSRWQFQMTYPIWSPDYSLGSVASVDALGGQGAPHVATDWAAFLRDYQMNGGATPGLLLGGCFVVAIAVGCAPARRIRGSELRGLGLAAAAFGGGLILAGDVFQYSLRYQLPGIVLLPVAGAAALGALLPGGGGSRSDGVGGDEAACARPGPEVGVYAGADADAVADADADESREAEAGGADEPARTVHMSPGEGRELIPNE